MIYGAVIHGTNLIYGTNDSFQVNFGNDLDLKKRIDAYKRYINPRALVAGGSEGSQDPPKF